MIIWTLPTVPASLTADDPSGLIPALPMTRPSGRQPTVAR